MSSMLDTRTAACEGHRALIVVASRKRFDYVLGGLRVLMEPAFEWHASRSMFRQIEGQGELHLRIIAGMRDTEALAGITFAQVANLDEISARSADFIRSRIRE